MPGTVCRAAHSVSILRHNLLSRNKIISVGAGGSEGGIPLALEPVQKQERTQQQR